MRHIATAVETDRSIGQVSAVGCVALSNAPLSSVEKMVRRKARCTLLTASSLDLLHGSKDSAHLDLGFEFDWHPVCIIGEPNQKTPTALKQPSKD